MSGAIDQTLAELEALALPPDSRPDDLRAFAARLQSWAAIFEQARLAERPHVASCMLDCAVRLRGAAQAYRFLAAELEDQARRWPAMAAEDLP